MNRFKNEISLAKQWRRDNPQCTGGYVLLCDGAVTGWKRELVHPETEMPGSLAISENEEIFVSFGGDDINGSTGWKPTTE